MTDRSRPDTGQSTGQNTGRNTGQDLSDELTALQARYVTMFGVMPPLPAGKFAYFTAADPATLLLVERLRRQAFENDVFDPAVTQLIIFAMMLATGGGAAEWHAIAARRAGATWEQLQSVVFLAASMSALGPANVGGALLNKLAAGEAGTDSSADH